LLKTKEQIHISFSFLIFYMGNTNLDVKRIKSTYLLVFTSEFHIDWNIYTVSIGNFFQTRKFI
jgi:hypothetical protein